MFHTVTIMFAGAAICIGSAVLLITIEWIIWDAIHYPRLYGGRRWLKNSHRRSKGSCR